MENWYGILFLIDIAALVSVLLANLAHRNATLVRLYVLQSVLLSVLLFTLGFFEGDRGLLWVALLSLFVKAVLAPIFFFRLLRRFGGQASTGTNYSSTPITLGVILLIVAVAHSKIIVPLGTTAPEALGMFSINLAMVLVSILLLINRRGVFSQIIGILSLENSIVFLSVLAGARTSIGLEVGILFDLFVWIVVATVFVSIIYRQFGSLSSTEMKKLIEE